jgi:microcin C transport system permease protein
MGYFGGWVDLAGQRAVEVWQNIPFLYMVIIVVAAVSDLPFTLPAWFKILVLLAIMVVFSWTSMTYYMRTAVYREKARDYVAAAQLLGASTPRILFNHLLPNTISTMVTFMPFTVATAIISITALDYLNFGLPKPTPSWGELLQQGVANLHAPWIVLSAFAAMVLVLTLVTFIGEGVREAFDPKKFTTYE